MIAVYAYIERPQKSSKDGYKLSVGIGSHHNCKLLEKVGIIMGYCCSVLEVSVSLAWPKRAAHSPSLESYFSRRC